MIVVTGLGPGDLDRSPRSIRDLLLDQAWQLFVRTRSHPAAEQLAAMRDDIVFCDDLYESAATFDGVYRGIADRVLAAAELGPVVYAVPGGPTVGEFAVREIVTRGVDVEILPAETFVDAVLAAVGYDPLDRGLQILNGHDLSDPLLIDKPTIIAHLDRPEILADAAARISRALPEGTEVIVFDSLGSRVERRWVGPIDEIDSSYAGLRTSIWVDSEPGGLMGAIGTMERLRQECPWDREQTHVSLVKNLVEETYELIDAVAGLEPGHEVDWVGYTAVEEEVGDVLLQVLFHCAIAKQVGAFDVNDAAEVLRQKLVRRHPHVFGDVEVVDANEVKENWDRIKKEEKPGQHVSALDGIPRGMPALHLSAKIQGRAAESGFDWETTRVALAKAQDEASELTDETGGPAGFESRLGDLLFTLVSLARRTGLDAEVALRRSSARFEERFRAMESAGDLAGLPVSELERRWEEAKNLLMNRG